jgi:hypothetical protein
LIEQLVTKVSSSNLRTLSIDFTQSLVLIQEEEIRKAREAEASAAATRSKGSSKGSSKGLRATETSKQESTTLQLGQQSLPQISNAEVLSLIGRSIHKWTNTLVKVVFLNWHSTTFTLPRDVFEDLVLRADIEHLEITGMDIEFMDRTLHRLIEVADSKLEFLYLPVHLTASGISFAGLRCIAEACPYLKSFRCRFKHLSNIPASSPLSHRLKKLSVTNYQAHSEKQRVFDIARYLDSNFPDLESIETHDGQGNNAEQWDYIFDLVKLCQVVRKDEAHRRSSLQDEGVRTHTL